MWKMVAPTRNRFSHRPGLWQMPLLRVTANGQRQANVWKGPNQAVAPCAGADRWRRQIGTLAIPRKAKGHRQDGDAGFVVERRVVQPQPVAQPVPRGVSKWQPALVHTRAGCLPGNQQPRRRQATKNRARLVRGLGGGKTLGAEATGTDVRGKLLHPANLGPRRDDRTPQSRVCTPSDFSRPDPMPPGRLCSEAASGCVAHRRAIR